MANSGRYRGSFLCFLFQGLRQKDKGRPVTEDEFSFSPWISGTGGGEDAETGKSKKKMHLLLTNVRRVSIFCSINDVLDVRLKI